MFRQFFGLKYNPFGKEIDVSDVYESDEKETVLTGYPKPKMVKYTHFLNNLLRKNINIENG
ncbi:MAG: hypothetical protein GX383_06610 [Clostridium sp.]|jgi:hypothetical protein|nr:hypothetical protein [Clostridium sp.]